MKSLLYACFAFVGAVFASAPLTLAVSTNTPAAKGDIDGDGHGDVLLRHEASGYVAALGMASNTLRWASYLGGGFDADPLRLAATLDLDADGTEELVWRYGSSDLYIWTQMAGGTNIAYADYLLDEELLSGWDIMAAADFNQDGYGDLLVGHRDSGTWAVAYLEEREVAGVSFVEGIANVAGWSVAGAGDVDGDGYPDIVVQHERSGDAVILWMEDAVLMDLSHLHGSDSTSLYPWRIAGLSDVDGTGRVAFLMQLGGTGYYETFRAELVNDQWQFESEPLAGFTEGLDDWRVIGPR